MPKCYRTIVIERLRKEGGAFGIPRAHTGAKLAPQANPSKRFEACLYRLVKLLHRGKR